MTSRTDIPSATEPVPAEPVPPAAGSRTWSRPSRAATPRPSCRRLRRLRRPAFLENPVLAEAMFNHMMKQVEHYASPLATQERLQRALHALVRTAREAKPELGDALEGWVRTITEAGEKNIERVRRAEGGGVPVEGVD